MPTSNLPDSYDVVIVGGGPAGLSASLLLGRSRRRVLLLHDGPTRNARAAAAHNVFTRDGTPPGELLSAARQQLTPYNVSVRDEPAIDARSDRGGFLVSLRDGSQVRARKVLLATGVRDILPKTPGFQEVWGRGLYHCPYCHGWEVADGPIGLYGNGSDGVELAKLLLGWSRDLILFTDGPASLTPEDRVRIERKSVTIREERIVRLLPAPGEGMKGVELESGDVVPRSAMFFRPPQELRSDLAPRLGCELTAEGRIAADALARRISPGCTWPATQRRSCNRWLRPPPAARWRHRP